MKKIISVVTIISLTFIYCSSNDDPNRNTISFNDKFDIVENALLRLRPILDSLPEISAETGVGRHYALSNGLLYINSFKGIPFNDSIHTIRGITQPCSKTFIETISFLQKNYISAGFKSFNTWLFRYRSLFNEGYDDYRFIVINTKSYDTVGLSKFYKILDKKEQLLLVANNEMQEIK